MRKGDWRRYFVKGIQSWRKRGKERKNEIKVRRKVKWK